MSFGNDLIVVAMVTDPEPHHVCTLRNSDGSVMDANPCGPELAYFFEMERGMPRIPLEQFKILIGKLLNFLGKLRIEFPKLRGGMVNHNFELRPALNSFRASSASESSFPCTTSCSNC